MHARLWLVVALAGCLDAPPSDGPPGDTDVASTDPPPLADTDGDTGDTGAPSIDTDTDTDVADTDEDPVDTAPEEDTDPRTCRSFPVQDVMAVCDGAETVIAGLGDPFDATCPRSWDVDGRQHADLPAALADGSCDAACVYEVDRAVTTLHCGQPVDFVRWVAGHPAQTGDAAACPEVLEVLEAAGAVWVEDWEAYQQARPCP